MFSKAFVRNILLFIPGKRELSSAGAYSGLQLSFRSMPSEGKCKWDLYAHSEKQHYNQHGHNIRV